MYQQFKNNSQHFTSDLVCLKCEPVPLPVKRVVIYARVSTANQSQELSLESQLTGFTNLISSSPDMTLVKVYADEGITGTSAKKRPQFMQMVKDAENGQFDTIMTKSISRFARNTVECLEYVRELKERGVNIVFQKEGIDTASVVSEMLLTVLAAFAQEESRSISENLKWGIRKRFEIGEVRWCPTYGFMHENGRIVICGSEADVVRRIFSLYLHGMSAPKIAEKLNSQQISSPRGSVWTVKTVMQMLKNEKYIGDIVLQKYITVDHISHKSIRNDSSSVPSYYMRSHHDPIIDRSTFDQVQRIIELKAPHGECSRYPYADTEIICPFCGKRMVTRLMHVQRNKKAICCFGDEGCQRFSVKTWMLDECILSALSALDPKNITGTGDAALIMRKHLIATRPGTVEYYLLSDLVQRITFTRTSDLPAEKSSKSKLGWIVNIYWKCGIRSEVCLPSSHGSTEDPEHVAALYRKYLSRIDSGDYLPARPRNHRERIMTEDRMVIEK